MGIYDRDYQRGNYGQQSGFNLGGPTSLTTKIVIVMFGVYLVQLLTRPNHPLSPLDQGWFTDKFSLYPDLFTHPWHVFQLLTYGFLHDVTDLRHIAYNMIGLWFFGRAVEYRYGAREYLTFFLVAIVAAGLVWVLGEFAANKRIVSFPPMLGASGGITAVLILFALNFPHQTVLFMFFIPMPMWVLAMIIVVMDARGAVNRSDHVAFTAHLGGALFAFLYYNAGWRLERFIPSGAMFKQLRPKPKLRVVDPDEPEESTEDQVDAILQKIQEHGRDSLTRGERRILEEASREYQKR
ncbi:MAG TPA: rhomboid family intramembrane serine protease, partial [Lacipirellulaceae bacterium]|nr:rhomboid family intramembrane serine protease [Lacipirellulaceae bacterium]